MATAAFRIFRRKRSGRRQRMSQRTTALCGSAFLSSFKPTYCLAGYLALSLPCLPSTFCEPAKKQQWRQCQVGPEARDLRNARSIPSSAAGLPSQFLPRIGCWPIHISGIRVRKGAGRERQSLFALGRSFSGPSSFPSPPSFSPPRPPSLPAVSQ